ncbi:MAG: Fic family protein [Gemmatimonadaceae bacterium]
MSKPTKITPRTRALAWWKERVEGHRYVVSTSESPSPAVAGVLRKQRLVLDIANKRVWILTQPDRTDEREVFLRNYWAVIDIVLRGWAPAAIADISAVRLHLGEAVPPRALPAIQGANQSRYELELFDEFTLQLRPGTLSEERIIRLPATHAEVNVLGAADLLTTLDLPELERDLEAVSAWLRHLVIAQPSLDAAVTHRPRPLVLARLGALARELGNRALAEQLDTAVRAVTEYPPGAFATGIGSRISVPAPLIAAPRGTGEPWLDRQAMTLERFRAELDALLEERVGPAPGLRLSTLIGNARQAKQYDAYHNTTMEGYRISEAVSDAVVSGKPLTGPITSEAELRAVMAVQGYSRAFDLVIERARQAGSRTGSHAIDESLMLDLYGELFRPAVDSGTVSEADLRGWRTINVGLAGGWRHVPPSPVKLVSLIRGVSEYLARPDLKPLTRAVLAHIEFVTIHPFIDGNGRLARLLMNYALLTAGYPWITIRSDERFPYFQALERAQADGDVKPIGKFLALHIAQSVAAACSAPDSVRPRSRGYE